ncbi:hypothetical protein GGR57DRAFT_508090 [Xylariaceae sp. FL1272]|nr:hypothetical protein GGR57DRAFT_508090 [Xylariaceae sp. FL1272]
MADTDLIACVYPYGDSEFGHARKAIEDSPRYMPPRRPRQDPRETHHSRGARESTEPPENRGDDKDEDDDDNDPDTLPYIELRFSHGPRTSSGFVFGKDPDTSDIVLSSSIGHISRRHFALTYKNSFDDGCYRLIVRDLGSTHGTAVTYNNKGRKLRSKFDWIIDGFRVPNDTDKFIIEPHKNMKFQVVVTRHDITSSTYVDNVKQFHHGVAGTENLFGVLDIQTGPATERHSRVHTPVGHPILLPQGWIAQGGFGAVSRHWDVSTGKEYACKQPIGKRYDREVWEKEIDIMKSISHEHIVRLCFWNKTPLPLLYLEYMPFGNLEDEHQRAHFSHEECLVFFHQSLLALAYLHGRSEPVAHRDLKPENILVQYRDADQNPNYLHVRLSDFGLSKTGSLKTICGSETYCPPEIGNNYTSEKYTKAVDIWSLGVIMLRYAYSLPSPGSGFGIEWCKEIVEEAGSWDSEGLINILQRMLVIDAKVRLSAVACLHEASRLVISSQDRSATPTQASYVAGYRATIHHIPREGQRGEQQETLHIQPYSGISTACAATLINNPSKHASHDPDILAPSSIGHHSQSKASHQSTRELFFDRQGVVYMVIRRQAVSMRTTDQQLNAFEILKATNLPSAKRNLWLCKLKSYGVVVKGRKRGDYWVPFRDGVFLCQAIGLEDDLKPLLSCPGLSLPLRQDNYLVQRKRRRQPGKKLDNGYACLLHGGHTIVYQPIKEIVNATHLLKLGDVPRQQLATFFAANSGIAKEIVNRGSSIILGTYISFKDAISLCYHFDLDISPVQRLLQGQSGSTSIPDISPNGRPFNSSSAADPVVVPPDSQIRQPPDLSRSIYTEPSYQHGSYLAPTHHSYLQLLHIPLFTLIPTSQYCPQISQVPHIFSSRNGRTLSLLPQPDFDALSADLVLISDKVDLKISALDAKIDSKVAALDAKTSTLEIDMNDRFDHVDSRIDDLEYRLDSMDNRLAAS